MSYTVPPGEGGFFQQTVIRNIPDKIGYLTMKKILISALALAAFAAMPAHAINAKYREQLERSGCTEMNAGISCDIHKTKAQNAKQAPKTAEKPKLTASQQYGQIVGEAETILGMKGILAEEFLVEKGWRQQSDGDWKKAGHGLRIVEDKGVVRNAQIVK